MATKAQTMLEKIITMAVTNTRNTNIIAVVDMMRKEGVVRKIGMVHQNPTIVRNHQDLRNAITISPNQLEKSRLPRNGQDHNHQTKKSKTNENTLLLIPPVRNYLH